MTITALYEIFLNHSTICTDTRKIEKDCIFFALRGANFNGNLFAEQALEKGAAYAIIDERTKENDRFILVDNVLETLQQLANHHRSQFDIPVIAITGSTGKTTTKELLHAVLSSHYPTHATKGNFNNHIGVPLTLLSIPSTTEVAIIEMGANHIGEIAFLCEIAAPTHGVITNVGEAHLEGFGSLDGVKQAKGELYRYLETNKGIAFINRGEAYLNEMAGEKLYQIIYVKSETPNLTASFFETKLVNAKPFVKIAYLSKKGKLKNIKSQLIGNYNFNNIMTAVTLGRYFKVPFNKIKAAISQYQPSNNRSQIVEKNSNKFLLDAYNANPTSMTKAIESFVNYKGKKKIAILGDMLELGDYSEVAHTKILELGEQLELKIITVGKEFQNVKKGCWKKFADTKELKDWFKQESFNNTFFLLKGSRGIGLEALLKD